MKCTTITSRKWLVEKAISFFQPKETEMTLTLLLGLFPAYVLSELVPGNNVNFITRAGYKYIGEPEVHMFLKSELSWTI